MTEPAVETHRDVSALRAAIGEAAASIGHATKTKEGVVPMATTTNAAYLEWNTDQGAALLTAEILGRAEWDNAATDAFAQQGGRRVSSLSAIVALCRRTGSSPGATPSRSTTLPTRETETGSMEVTDKGRSTSSQLPSSEEACGCGDAAGDGRSDRPPLPWSDNETLTSAVLKSMAILVGAAAPLGARSAAAAVESGTSAVSVAGPAEGTGPKKMPPVPDQRQNSRSLFLKPPPTPHGHTGGGFGPTSPPPPLPPPPPPRSTLGEVSPATGVEVSRSKKGEVHRFDRGIGGLKGKDASAQVDTDNRRRVLVGGVLTLLQELFGKEGEGKPEGNQEDQGRVRDIDGQRGQPSVEQENMIWDIVIAVLSDSWSEIRKMGATHARSLAATFGPHEAWAFYIKAAAQCHASLLLPESESNQPRKWKHMHGLLLGMRAVVEGAAASTRVPSAAKAKVVSRIPSSSARGDKSLVEPRNITIGREGASSSSTRREAGTAEEAALAQFAADVRLACEATPPLSPPPLPSPIPQYFHLQQAPAQARVATPEPGAATADPLSGPTTVAMTHHPHPPPPPPSPAAAATTGADVAFCCLSHRQAAVREAAIGLLHAQARALGPRAALALYRRTLRTLEQEQEELGPNKEVSTTGVRRSPTARASRPLTVPEPDVNASNQDSAGGGAATALSSVGCPIDCGAEKVGVEGFRTGVPQAPSRAEARRRCDRTGGLLGLLERVVGKGDVLPTGTIGSSWVCLFSILRSYTGHPEASLRQAASAVFLRIATAPSSAATGVGIALPSSRNAATLVEEAVRDPSQWAAYFSDDASARVVLWALVCASSQQHQPLDSGRTEQTVRAEANNGDGGGGGKGLATPPSWQFREGVLLVYEGVLKRLVEGRLSEIASGVDEPCSATVHDDDGEGSRGEWPAELLHATPPLGELLVSLLCQAEDALYGAELMRSMSSHHHQQQPSEGSLELWRTGSQLLPTIGRAMVWWNPRAILRACERAASTNSKSEIDTEGKDEDILSSSGGLVAANRPPPSMTLQNPPLLRRTTRISVASELLRASVRHARHLAEVVVDGSVSALDAAGVEGADDDDGDVGGQARNRAASVIIEIANRERWGGSTDGIADTSDGSGGGGGSVSVISNKFRTSVQVEHEVESTAASATVGAMVAGQPVAAERARIRNVWESASARIVGEILRLSRETPSLLVRALAALTCKGGILLPGRDREEEINPTPAARECTTALPRECLDSPPVAGATAVGEAVVAPWNHQWVFTGVIEALVLAESLVATTTVGRDPTKTEKLHGADFSRGPGGYSGGGQQLSGPLASSPFSPASAAGVVGGKAGGEMNISSTGSGQTQKATELNLAAQSGHLTLIENQLELLHRQAHSTAGSDGWSASTRGTLVVPFSWGSMSLLHAPTRFEEMRNEGLGGDDGGAGNPLRGENQLRDCQSRWRAVKLDRLLSSRIVRALPGYIGCLPLQRSVGIVPTLLRWLEVDDHNVRWISVSPSEAHTHLLSAVGIALQTSVGATKNSLGQCRQHRRRIRQKPQQQGEVEAEEEEWEGRREVVTVVSAVVGTMTRMLTSSDTKVAGLFQQMCALAIHIVDLLPSLLLEQDRLLVQPPIRRGRHSQSPTRFATLEPGRSGVDNNLDLCTLATSLLRSVAEHLLRWYPEHAEVVEAAGKDDFQYTEDDGACESIQSGGGSGSDWDDWDDDDDDATEQRGVSASNDVADGRRTSAAFHGTAALVRSATAFFTTASSPPAAAEIGRSRVSSSPSAKITPSKPLLNEEQGEEGGRCPAKAVLAPIPSGADAVANIASVDEGQTEGLTQRTRIKPVDDGSNLFDLHYFPSSFVAVLKGMASEHRQALLRAWASVGVVKSPRCREKWVVTGGKPASVGGG